ncbi:hypothetical protein K0U07_03600 [bacterium]|nr:hypothetical protein [bacterium]
MDSVNRKAVDDFFEMAFGDDIKDVGEMNQKQIDRENRIHGLVAKFVQNLKNAIK